MRWSMAWRNQVGARLRENRLMGGLELLIVALLPALKLAGVLRNASLLLLLYGWLSLWLRRSGWRAVGLARPINWPLTILAAIVIGLAYNALDIGVLIPFLEQLTGEPLVAPRLDSLEGNVEALLAGLVLIWLLAAFGEEMAYRGYLLNRLADVLGRSAPSWAFNVLLVSVAFGLAHSSQGPTGILDNIIAGLLFAGLYLASGRNLWLPILVHGVIDTSSMVLLYFGVLP